MNNPGTSLGSTITPTLISCLERVLFVSPVPSSTAYNTATLSQQSDECKTWKPGKATEILRRFKKDQLLPVVGPGTFANYSPRPPSTTVQNSTNVNKVDEGSKKVLNLHRPFRPPSRQPVATERPAPESWPVSQSPEVHAPAEVPSLFTTHSAQFNSTSANSKPASSTGFTFGGDKRFQSNARALFEKRSIYSKYKKKRAEFDDDEEVPEVAIVEEKDKEPILIDVPVAPSNRFKSAYEVMVIEDRARGIKRSLPPPGSSAAVSETESLPKLAKVAAGKAEEEEGLSDNPEVNLLMKDERLKNVEPKMVEAVLNEVVELGADTDWNDIAGLESVKDIIREIIIWPMQRPDLFTGLRGPPKGILLFGPPGTGKTMFGRLIATKSSSTFFNISASSLMSKWCGDGEKMVRALFQVARVKQPSVVFIDEIDSILTQRSESEHETSRRLKTEFLIQFDGCGTKCDDKLLVIGVTNRPQELDEAARRRLVKRIYIPLPESQGRKQLVKNLLRGENSACTDEDFEKLASLTEGYSGADMASLCREASYGPIRDIRHDLANVRLDAVRPIGLKDFQQALKHVTASVAQTDLTQYEAWDRQFGCHV